MHSTKRQLDHAALSFLCDACDRHHLKRDDDDVSDDEDDEDESQAQSVEDIAKFVNQASAMQRLRVQRASFAETLWRKLRRVGSAWYYLFMDGQALHHALFRSCFSICVHLRLQLGSSSKARIRSSRLSFDAHPGWSVLARHGRSVSPPQRSRQPDASPVTERVCAQRRETLRASESREHTPRRRAPLTLAASRAHLLCLKAVLSSS